MVTDEIEIPANSTLNVEGKANVALCPMCTEELSNAESSYIYQRNNPDTRWFYCTTCECHLGYHRMKGAWKVDPHDLDKNDTIREYFGLGPAIEKE